MLYRDSILRHSRVLMWDPCPLGLPNNVDRGSHDDANGSGGRIDPKMHKMH